MATRKNHHFVPQFYFRRFSKDGHSICVIRRDDGKLIECAPIKSQASKGWFYGNDTVESALGAIEGDCSSALKQLTECQTPTLLDPDEVTLTLLWLVLQRSRTMAARQAAQPFNDKLFKLFREIEINKDTALSEDARREMVQGLDYVASDPVEAQLLQMEVAMESVGYLRDLTPMMLINKTNRPFVFGDAPVVFYNAFLKDVKLRGVLGFDTPGLLVFFPLTTRLTLALVDPRNYAIKRMRDNVIKVDNFRDIAALNKLQIHAASSCVYFDDFKFAAYASELWRQENQQLKAHATEVVQAPGFSSESGEPIGDIMHGFQSQLPYDLSLTFLEHDVIGDNGYRFSRRSRAFA